MYWVTSLSSFSGFSKIFPEHQVLCKTVLWLGPVTSWSLSLLPGNSLSHRLWIIWLCIGKNFMNRIVIWWNTAHIVIIFFLHWKLQNAESMYMISYLILNAQIVPELVYLIQHFSCSLLTKTMILSLAQKRQPRDSFMSLSFMFYLSSFMLFSCCLDTICCITQMLFAISELSLDQRAGSGNWDLGSSLFFPLLSVHKKSWFLNWAVALLYFSPANTLQSPGNVLCMQFVHDFTALKWLNVFLWTEMNWIKIW